MSTFIDLGDWRTGSGWAHLTWWSDSGAVVLGDQDVIAFVADELDLRRRLAGYETRRDQRGGLGWVAQQLEGCR